MAMKVTCDLCDQAMGLRYTREGDSLEDCATLMVLLRDESTNPEKVRLDICDGCMERFALTDPQYHEPVLSADKVVQLFIELVKKVLKR